MQLSLKEETFSQFLSTVLKSRLTLNTFEEKMTLIGNAFRKIRTSKNVVR